MSVQTKVQGGFSHRKKLRRLGPRRRPPPPSLWSPINIRMDGILRSSWCSLKSSDLTSGLCRFRPQGKLWQIMRGYHLCFWNTKRTS